MARALTVFRRYQPGLAAFRNLNSEAVEELSAALQNIPSTTNSYTVSSAVADKIHTIPASDVEEIVPALLHIHSFRNAMGLPVSELAAGLVLGMEQEFTEESEALLDDSDEFESRLVEVLNIGSLRTIARAAGLFYEREHIATQARIMTDIRPIFEQESPQARPVGAMIFHTLKITYLEGDEEKNFFVALDADDVRELSEQLQRANSKAESLRKSVLDVAQIPHVDSD